MTGELHFASWIEIIQLLLSVVAAAFGFWRLWVAIENGMAITATAGMDLRRIVAETQILSELFRLFKIGCLVAMGIISVLLPPPYVPGPTDTHPIETETLQGVLLRLGLITMTVAMVVDSLVQEQRRRAFIEAVATGPAMAAKHKIPKGDPV